MEEHCEDTSDFELQSGLERFRRWFFDNGGTLHREAHLVENEDGRYNVRVRGGCVINDDEIVVSCPTALTFSFITNGVGIGEYRLKDERAALPQDVMIRLKLMDHHLLGAKSFWWPYISILPQPVQPPNSSTAGVEGVITTLVKRPFNTPVYFEDEDMLWLKGTNLGAAAGSRANEWREEFENAKDSINGLNESKQALWTSDLYIWAATIFTTRSFSASALRIPGLDSPVLIPGVDLLNHSPHAKVTWTWSPSTCSVQTNQNLETGDEICNNYGAKSNEELLMGFGFCLEDNQADSFNLSYAPALSRHIKAAKARRSEFKSGGPVSEIQPPSTSLIEGHTVTPGDSNHDLAEDVKFVSFGDGDYSFCPGFLADCSLALQNKRERQQDLVCSLAITRFSNDTLSRNKLHTISSILMILQQKQMEIRQFDKGLPLTPKNQNQVYASIYRSSQLQILEGVLQALSSTMQSISQIRFGELQRIIRLMDVLNGTPRSLKRHLREVIHAGVRTREANKIIERGGVKFAFAMWLCGLRLVHSSGTLADRDTALSEWIGFLCGHYDHHAIDECIRDVKDRNAPVSKAEEIAATVRSYTNAIQIAAQRHQDSIYNCEWARNPANLTWCLVVIREEGVRCPTVTESGILGEDKDEFVVVIDAEKNK